MTHTYTLDGSKILRETWGDNVLIPLYDNEDSVCGILYNGTPYYFLKNLQGDVIAITNEEGQTVVEYDYDAWGVCFVADDMSGDNIEDINPFRYRGYYYDAEIGMYYLQSRYYDPVTGRFMNTDEACVLLGYSFKATPNFFIYCNNDCVNEQDHTGYAISSYIHAIGVQLSFTVSGKNFGFEFLWNTKTWRFVLFFFAGISADLSSSKGYNMIEKYIVPVFKNARKSASSIMRILSNTSLAVSFMAVKRQSFPADYCGRFFGFSLAFKLWFINIAISGAMATNSKGIIGSVGVGVSSSSGANLAATYYIQLTGQNRHANNIAALLSTVQSRIKEKLSIFEAAAKILV